MSRSRHSHAAQDSSVRCLPRHHTPRTPWRAIDLCTLGTFMLGGCGGGAPPDDSPGGQARAASQPGLDPAANDRSDLPGGPRQQAVQFRRSIDGLTAAQDFAAAIEHLRRMNEYLATLSEPERVEFASHWTDPSLAEWLSQTTATLQADAHERVRSGHPIDMPPLYAGPGKKVQGQ